MNIYAKCISAAFLLAAPTGASAASLSSLSGGGTLTVDDVTFSGFSFSDNGSSITLDPTLIFVTGSSDATSVTLTFDFDPSLDLGGLDNYEFESGFMASAAAPSTRHFESVTIGLTGVDRDGNAFVEVGSFDPFLYVTESDLLGSVLTDSATIAAAGMVDFGFFSTGESRDSASTISLSQFTVTLGLDSAFTPVETVPLPAALPLMLGGLGLLGFAAARRRRAA